MSEPSRDQIRAIGVLGSPAIAAWRFPRLDGADLCSIPALNVGPSGLGLVGVQSGLFTDETAQNFVFVEPVDELRSLATPEMVFPYAYLEGGRGIRTGWPGAAITYYLMTPDLSVIGHERSSDRYVTLNRFGGPAQNVRVIYGQDDQPDRILWERWGTHVTLAAATFNDETWQDVIDVSAADGDVRSVSLGEEQLVWLQGYEYGGAAVGYERSELWTAAVVDDLSTLAPRMVRVLPDHAAGANGARFFARLETIDELRSVAVYDLNDGARRIWQAPDSTPVLDTPLFVDGGWVYVQAGSNTYRFDAATLPVVPE